MSRWTDPAPEGNQIIVVLKDLNFEGQFIQLGKVSYLLAKDMCCRLHLHHCIQAYSSLFISQINSVLGSCVRWRSTQPFFRHSMCQTTASCWPISPCTRMNSARLSLSEHSSCVPKSEHSKVQYTMHIVIHKQPQTFTKMFLRKGLLVYILYIFQMILVNKI